MKNIVRKLIASDLQIIVHELLADEDRVVAYFTLCGTDTVRHIMYSPGGKQVTYSSIDVFQLAEGKVVERWGILATVSMLYEIGTMI